VDVFYVKKMSVNINCLLFVVDNEALFSCCILHWQQIVLLHCRCVLAETKMKLFLWAKCSSKTLVHKIINSVASVMREK